MGPPPGTPIDRAGADDVLLLAVDRGGRVPMSIGALLVLDPAGRPGAEAVRSTLLRRAGSVPRLGQRLVRAPIGAGRPVWTTVGADRCETLVDAVTAAPDPGSAADAVPRALLDATAELVATRLDLDRPLWRARLLLDEHRLVAGIAIVAHHVLADGMGGLAVLGALADDERRDEPPPMPSAGSPRPPWGALARDAWGRRARALRVVPGAARRMGAGAGELGLGRPRLADRCSLLGRTGDRRRLEVASAELGLVRDEARAHGASINDVVVAAVTGALVELLARRGERIAELVVSVPVSRRGQGEAAALGNSTGVVPVRVPAVADHATRLAALVAERGRVRAPGRGGSAAVLTPVFRGLAAVGAFQLFVDHQRLVHTFVTNVRGPEQRLRVAGAEVVGVVPVAVNPGNVAVSFDVLSYAGTLVVTLVCDPVLVPESAWLATRVAAGLTASD
ncbi:MAG TPA: wax ester/triacylglycerol synthase domain-containing protein [Ornithinibacter sp.]|nr:wax ester/triacylglycerol synthase domain-containing protein [Ornithinibacter sp.]